VSSVTVLDTVAPVVICRNITVQLNASGSASITASQVNNGSHDNCGISLLTVTPNDFSCTNVGPNTVTLTATDASGNTSSCSAVVTVQDNIAPHAICKSIIVQL